MNEIYWLTRFEAIHNTATIFTIFAVAGLVLGFVSYLEMLNDGDKPHIPRKILKISIPAFLISVLLLIFVPTTKEALLIWGVGGTIDYIKSDEAVKQLPDKCIQALDEFVDEYIDEPSKQK